MVRAYYQASGCADIAYTNSVAQRIDARQFNPGFPQPFPPVRFSTRSRGTAPSASIACNGNHGDRCKSCDDAYAQFVVVVIVYTSKHRYCKVL